MATEMPTRSVHSGNLGAGPSNIFSEGNSIELILKYVNAHGAHIYQDENGNYYYRVGDVATPTPEKLRFSTTLIAMLISPMLNIAMRTI